MLLSLRHQPVELILLLFDAVETPARHPVVGEGVENEARALLARGKSALLPELLPLGLGLLSWDRFLAGQHLHSLRHIKQKLAFRILQNLAIWAMLDILLLLEVEELLVENAQVGGRALRELLRAHFLVRLAVLNEKAARVAAQVHSHLGRLGFDRSRFGLVVWLRRSGILPFKLVISHARC